MEILYPLIAALLPAVLLYFYIQHQDRAQPEPRNLLLKGVWYGILAAILAVIIEMPLDAIHAQLFPASGLISGFSRATFVAAIPEEVCKLGFLWLLLRKNPYFDERFDGIVYAVCVGLGFAGLENIFYIISTPDWLSLAVMRGIFSVPGHFFYAVLMGYFYSIAHFKMRSGATRSMALIAPVIAHAIYDGLLMSRSEEMAGLSALLFLIFLWFCYKLNVVGRAKIRELKGK